MASQRRLHAHAHRVGRDEVDEEVGGLGQVQERRAHGEPVSDLTESNPTRAGIRYPAEITAALADPSEIARDLPKLDICDPAEISAEQLIAQVTAAEATALASAAVPQRAAGWAVICGATTAGLTVRLQIWLVTEGGMPLLTTTR